MNGITFRGKLIVFIPLIIIIFVVSVFVINRNETKRTNALIKDTETAVERSKLELSKKPAEPTPISTSTATTTKNTATSSKNISTSTAKKKAN
jgi:hypothetical protein